jgi:alpha/beta superfamily hydrolase
MAQPVVYRCAQACRDEGFASLRFNFRGVGRSRGTYSGKDEYRDVEAAAAFLREEVAARVRSEAERGLLSGTSTAPVPLVMAARQSLTVAAELPFAVAGYSFGSVMAAVSAVDVMPDALVLIGFAVESELFPPAALDRLGGYPNPILAVCGESDDLAPPEVVRAALEGLGVNFRMVVLRDTGHFFEGRQREVGEAAAAFISEKLSR